MVNCVLVRAGEFSQRGNTLRGGGRSYRIHSFLALAWGIILGSEPLARAQEVVINAQEAVVAPDAADAADEADEAGVVQPARGVWVMTDDQFDQWVFGAPRNSRAGRNKLDSLLTLEIDEVERSCSLSEIEKKKLLLAGRGDIKRFFEKVDEKRKKFEKIRNDQNKIGEIYQELLPLQSMLNSGLFGDGSFYCKTLRRLLSDEESAAYQKIVFEKKQFRYRAKVELVVAQLDQAVGFRDEQRRRLVDVILRETQPPLRYGQYDYYLVLYQAGKIPAAKLKPLFEEKQWAFLQRQLDQGRGMEHFLRTQGLLPAVVEGRDIAREFVRALRQPAQPVAELPADVFTPAR
jgi:hypothetical protein